MIRLHSFTREHFLGVDAGVVIALTLLFIAWFLSFGGASHVDALMQGNRANIYGTTATIAGSLLGFSIAVTSIVIGLSSSDRLAIVRGSAHYSTLWKTFLQTTRCLGALTITALICLIRDKDTDPVSWFVIPFLLFAGLSVVRLARSIWILEQLIEIIIKPQPGTDTRQSQQ